MKTKSKDRQQTSQKFELHCKIVFWENRLKDAKVDMHSPLYYLLSHARKEWAYHNFVQVRRDLIRLQQNFTERTV